MFFKFFYWGRGFRSKSSNYWVKNLIKYNDLVKKVIDEMSSVVWVFELQHLIFDLHMVFQLC